MAAPTGNNNAGQGKKWSSAIKRALARKAEDTTDRGLDMLADKLIEEALNGTQWAVQEVACRIDGKATEHTVIDQTVRHLDLGNADSLASKLRQVVEKPAESSGFTVQ